MSRAIEVMAPSLRPDEHHEAVGFVLSRLAGQDDRRPRYAIPRALNRLIARDLDPGEVRQVSADLPKAIMISAARRGRSESSYVLAMVQVAETVGDRLGNVTATTLARGFAQQLTETRELRERAALARAAIRS